MTVTTSTSITTALGVGSGIDINNLVQSLVDNSFSVKTKQLAAKSDTLTAQISGIAKLKSGIAGFDSALKSLTLGGSLATQPTSSDSSVVSVTTLAGSKLGALSTSVRVERLAAAQAATSTTPVARTAGFPKGSLQITMGATSPGDTPTRTIAIPEGATLEQIAAKINGEKLGLTATVVGDGNGARLAIKGATGASQAFGIRGLDDVAPADPAAPSLASLSVGDGAGGMEVGSTAADAVVYLDGARFTRASNTITDLVPGVRMSLTGTSDRAVTLGTTPPTSALGQAVNDFVATYNELLSVIKAENDPQGGVLKSDPAVAAMARSLSTLTTTPLAVAGSAGAPRTLADIGVATNRDGTLRVDANRLSAALSANPAAVEAMFASGTGATNGGLSAALGAIAAKATDKTYGLEAASTRYAKLQDGVAEAQEKATDAAASMKERMTQQFAAMDAKVAAYKSTQTFLDNQIKAWNKSDS